MSVSGQPARSSAARVGRKSKQAWASAVRPSRLIRTYTDRHGLKELVRELLGQDVSKQQQSSDWGAADLSEAQRVQPHGFGIDRDGARAQRARGQIFFMEIYAHAARLRRSRRAAQ